VGSEEEAAVVELRILLVKSSVAFEVVEWLLANLSGAGKLSRAVNSSFGFSGTVVPAVHIGWS
jgi:hypothetical protein